MHPVTRTDRRLAAIVAVATALALLVVGAAAPARAAGATLVAPKTLAVGDELVLTGAGWLDQAGDAGSVIAFKLDEGAVLATGDVKNPASGAVIGNKQVYAAVQADADGAWEVRIASPAAWKAGETHSVRLLSGSLLAGDVTRSQSATFEVVTAGVAPKITEQPDDVTVTEGDDATFSAAGTGSPDPDVRWQTDASGAWKDVAGGTSDALTLEDVGLDQDGTHYRAVFTNASGDVISDPATLSVTPRAVATLTVPATLVVGATLVVSGKGWLNQAGTAGSVVAVKLDEGAVTATGDVVNPATGAVLPNKTIVAAVEADSRGAWTVSIPFPKAWTAATAHSVHVLSGSLRTGDVTRSQSGDLDVVAAEVPAQPTISVPSQLVVGDELVVSGKGWLNKAGTAGSVVAVKLDDGAVTTTTDVLSPVDGTVLANKTIVAAARADASGAWSLTVPVPATWAAGETHNVRVLSGSLLTDDVVRSQAGDIVVVAPDRGCAADEVLVSDTAAGQTATACVQRDVSTGGRLTVRGDGWTTRTGKAGATVVLKLASRPTPSGTDFQFVQSGQGVLTHPGNGKKDATIWAIATADATGHFSTTVAVPGAANVPSTVGAAGTLKAGSKLVVHLQTGLLTTDTTHSVDSASLVVDGTAYAGDRDGQVTTCKATGPATARVVAPAGQVVDPVAGPILSAGGTLHLVGSGWCAADPADGGSVIAIKIDEGTYSHPAGELVNANPQVWALIRVNSADGSFDTTITLPTATGAGSSTPAFGDGAHSLRLLSGSLKSGDVIRSVETGTFTIGAYKPNGLPDPVEATEDLTAATRHGVTVRRTASALTVTIPRSGDGAWAYLTAYLPDGSVRYPFASTWFTTDDDVVRAPLAGVTLPTGTWRLAVQSPDGTVLGWASVTVPAAAGQPTGTGDGTDDDPGSDRSDDASTDPTSTTTDAPSDDAPAGTSPRTTPRIQPVAAVKKAAPTTTPKPPAADGDALAALPRGGVIATQEGSVVTLTLPGTTPGDWVFVYVYSTPVPVAWVQVDAARQIRVDLSRLGAGEHKVAVLDEDGTLVGWADATVEGPAVEEPAPAPLAAEPEAGVPAAPVGAAPVTVAAPAEGLGTANAVLIGVAAALLVAGAAVVVVVRRRRTASAGGAA